MNCKYCNEKCVKKGKRSGKQRYRCSNCMKYQLRTYKKTRIDDSKVDFLRKLNNEGVGISSISRLLNISKSSVQRVIKRLYNQIQQPVFNESNQSYEIDELRTYVGSKSNECWVIYAINKLNGVVIEMTVGRRTKENIRKVVNTVLSLNPKRIFTDGLVTYKGLIPQTIHRVFQYNTNKIERKNLTLRTHIKRLVRKTICYSKSTQMLDACLKIYLWA